MNIIEKERKRRQQERAKMLKKILDDPNGYIERTKRSIHTALYNKDGTYTPFGEFINKYSDAFENVPSLRWSLAREYNENPEVMAGKLQRLAELYDYANTPTNQEDNLNMIAGFNGTPRSISSRNIRFKPDTENIAKLFIGARAMNLPMDVYAGGNRTMYVEQRGIDDIIEELGHAVAQNNDKNFSHYLAFKDYPRQLIKSLFTSENAFTSDNDPRGGSAYDWPDRFEHRVHTYINPALEQYINGKIPTLEEALRIGAERADSALQAFRENPDDYYYYPYKNKSNIKRYPATYKKSRDKDAIPIYDELGNITEWVKTAKGKERQKELAEYYKQIINNPGKWISSTPQWNPQLPTL